MTAPPAPPAAERPYRELTVAAWVLGVAVGVVMTAAFVYVALKLGFTMPASTVAAILGFVVLRGLVSGGTILENNLNQTVASAVNAASGGVSFTLPALFLLHADFGPLPVILAGVGGAMMGIVVIIPLRKQMIELERLRFPSGVAVASLLRAPGAGKAQLALLGGGLMAAMLPHALVGLGWLPETLSLSPLLGLPEYLPLALSVSFASLGAGLLSGRGGAPMVLGGVLAWWVAAPAAMWLGAVPAPGELGVPEGEAYETWATWDVIYAQMLRPIGIGVLIGGALTGVGASLPALRAAITSLRAAGRVGLGGGEELSARALGGGLVFSFVVLYSAAALSSPEIGLLQGALLASVGTLWLALAGLIVAQANGMTDISPLSGMSLIGVTLMYFLSGGQVVPALMLGVAIAIGIGQCADMMSDLKAGQLIGATPRVQQLAQLSASWIGVPVAVFVVYLLWGAGEGFGPGNPDLSAPQGSAMAAVIESLSAGAAPVDKYLAGALIGLGLGALPGSGLGVLVGLSMYLPLDVTLTYGLGGLVSVALERARGPRWMGNHVVPVAAGFIIGEALTSLVVALIRIGLA